MNRSLQPAVLTVALSAAALLGYLAYRHFGAGARPATAPATDSEPVASGAALADALPPFTLANLAGEPTPIASWSGRPLLINFWATWCAPCRREIPLLKEFQSVHADIQVVGIAVDSRDPVVAYAAQMGFNYPVLVGQTDAMEAAAALGVGVLVLPITVFTDPAGAVLGIRTGEIHTEHLENYRATLAGLAAGRFDRATARARMAGTL